MRAEYVYSPAEMITEGGFPQRQWLGSEFWFRLQNNLFPLKDTSPN